MVALGWTSKPEELAVSMTAESSSVCLFVSPIEILKTWVYFDAKYVLLFWEAKELSRCLLFAMIDKPDISKFCDLGIIYILANKYFIADMWIFIRHSSVWKY